MIKQNKIGVAELQKEKILCVSGCSQSSATRYQRLYINTQISVHM